MKRKSMSQRLLEANVESNRHRQRAELLEEALRDLLIWAEEHDDDPPPNLAISGARAALKFKP